MARPHALLRAGFPYLTTIGATWETFHQMYHPGDVAFGEGGRIYALCGRTGGTGRLVGGPITLVGLDDEALGHFDLPEGGMANKYPEEPVIDGQFVWPGMIVLDEDENLYATDEALHRINMWDKEGSFLGLWGEYGDAEGQLNRPSGMAFDSEQHLLVVDTQNHRVQKFTKDGKYISGWGSRGAGGGEFEMPWGIAIDDEGFVYIGDWGNHRVQKLTADGEFVFEFGSFGAGDGEFDGPAGLDVDQDGDIYVADRGNDRVQLFDYQGGFVQKFLGDATLSKTTVEYWLGGMTTVRETNRMRQMAANIEPEKRLTGPRSVRVDDEGRMFIPDYESYRIQVYQKEAYRLSEDQIAAPLPVPKLKYI